MSVLMISPVIWIKMNTSITAIDGITVGHWQDTEAKTGCTVVLCPAEGCLASGFAFGSSPGSREYALLAPEKSVERINAILLTGGSAFGLDAATGVMRWLEQQGRGYVTPFGKVPIVPAAVIFDLSVGRADIRPDAESGYLACVAAAAEPVLQGRVGVGVGASCGKYLGFDYASAGGLGSALRRLQGASIAALVVSNPNGDVIDPATGSMVSGCTANESQKANLGLASNIMQPGMNTTLVVVATDAKLNKAQAHYLAQSAHIGIARVTRPSHTVVDGDTTFVLSTGQGPELSPWLLSVLVQEVVAEAIVAGVQAAKSVT